MGVVALVLALAVPALADPVALRVPAPDASMVVAPGWPSTSAAWWAGPRLGLAVDTVLPGAALGVHAGIRTTLLGQSDHGAGLDLSASAGLVAPLRAPGMALALTPALRGRVRGARLDAGLGLVAPALAGVAGSTRGAKLSPALEGSLGLRVADAAWVFAVGDAGASLWTGGLPTLAAQGTVGVALGL